jgi:hypothetical protein
MHWRAADVGVVAAAGEVAAVCAAAVVAVFEAAVVDIVVAGAAIVAAEVAIAAETLGIAEAEAELAARHRWGAPTAAHPRSIVQAAGADTRALGRATVICQLQAVGPAPVPATVREVSLAHVPAPAGARVPEHNLARARDQEQV